MFKEAFSKLDPDESLKRVEMINSEVNDFNLDTDKTIILSQDLSFYPHCSLLDVQDFSLFPTKHVFLIQHKGGNGNDNKNFTVLDWTNTPIFKLNSQVPITLNTETVRSYIRFFFNFVYGEHGRFLLIDSIDEIPWREEPPISARKSISSLIEPLTLKKETKDGFIFKATLIFKDSLFSCFINVFKNGNIEITNETILVEDIPAIDDILKE